jgi:hypothetical protein
MCGPTKAVKKIVVMVDNTGFVHLKEQCAFEQLLKHKPRHVFVYTEDDARAISNHVAGGKKVAAMMGKHLYEGKFSIFLPSDYPRSSRRLSCKALGLKDRNMRSIWLNVPFTRLKREDLRVESLTTLNPWRRKTRWTKKCPFQVLRQRRACTCT